MFFVLLATLKLDTSDPRILWQEAMGMLQATPRSSWSLLTSHQPLDTALHVAPDEVLQHIYERPPVDWRLVVLDLRRQAAGLALPVCVRLPLSERLDVSVIPRDPAIHLCLVGDDLKETSEMCHHLCEDLQMCHISMVDGGWPALEQLVLALGLELLPPSPAPPSPEVSTDQATTGWMEALKAPSWALGWSEASGKQLEGELMDV